MRVDLTTWVGSVGLILVLAAPCSGTEARFFRIVSTQATEIVHFDTANAMTWSNTFAPATCSVEWTPDLHGLWLTNHFPTSTLCTTLLHHINMPGVFATGTPSTVIYHAPGAAFRVMDSMGVDLGRDGEEDILFKSESISSCDVPSSTHYAALLVETRNAEIITRPYTNGEAITETQASGDVWAAAPRHGQTFVSSWLHFDWVEGGGEGYSQGPWYGTSDAYLPVRVEVNSRYHYGWIRLKLSYLRFNNVTDFWLGDYRILDSGLQAVPGESIRAGQK